MRLPAIILACLFVLNAGAQTTLKLVRTIPLPGVSGRIDHMAADTQGHRFFMAALGNDTVEVMDIEAGKRLQTISGCSEPQGLVFLPKQNHLFIANGGSSELKIYDGEKFQLLKTTGSLGDADNVRLDATNNRVYVGFGSGALGAFDTNGVQVANIPLDGHPESFQLEQNGNRIFVNVPGDRSIAVIDRVQQNVVAKWRLTEAHSNFPMALDEANHRLFVGCRSPARLLVLDTTSGKTTTQVEISEFMFPAAKVFSTRFNAARVTITNESPTNPRAAAHELLFIRRLPTVFISPFRKAGGRTLKSASINRNKSVVQSAPAVPCHVRRQRNQQDAGDIRCTAHRLPKTFETLFCMTHAPRGERARCDHRERQAEAERADHRKAKRHFFQLQADK
jgi:hypothetical protein